MVADASRSVSHCHGSLDECSGTCRGSNIHLFQAKRNTFLSGHQGLFVAIELANIKKKFAFEGSYSGALFVAQVYERVSFGGSLHISHCTGRLSIC